MVQQAYTLGLDIGMASVGAALLADDHIIALHLLLEFREIILYGNHD